MGDIYHPACHTRWACSGNLHFHGQPLPFYLIQVEQDKRWSAPARVGNLQRAVLHLRGCSGPGQAPSGRQQPIGYIVEIFFIGEFNFLFHQTCRNGIPLLACDFDIVKFHGGRSRHQAQATRVLRGAGILRVLHLLPVDVHRRARTGIKYQPDMRRLMVQEILPVFIIEATGRINAGYAVFREICARTRRDLLVDAICQQARRAHPIAVHHIGKPGLVPHAAGARRFVLRNQGDVRFHHQTFAPHVFQTADLHSCGRPPFMRGQHQRAVVHACNRHSGQDLPALRQAAFGDVIKILLIGEGFPNFHHFHRLRQLDIVHGIIGVREHEPNITAGVHRAAGTGVDLIPVNVKAHFVFRYI